MADCKNFNCDFPANGFDGLCDSCRTQNFDPCKEPFMEDYQVVREIVQSIPLESWRWADGGSSEFDTLGVRADYRGRFIFTLGHIFQDRFTVEDCLTKKTASYSSSPELLSFVDRIKNRLRDGNIVREEQNRFSIAQALVETTKKSAKEV